MSHCRAPLLVVLLSACGPVAPGPDAGAPDAGATDGGEGWVELWDGASFAGWDTFLGPADGGVEPVGLNRDDRGVFTIATVDGAAAIHVSGELWGCLATQAEYGNLDLTLEYRWGTRFWPPLNFFDSGVMVLGVGPFGAVNAGGFALSSPPNSGSFLVSMEYQLAPHDIGGLYNLGPIAKGPVTRTAQEDLPGAWNAIEIVVRDGCSTHWLNGVQVAQACGYELQWPGQAAAPLRRGKIQLQSEGGEIYFRKVRLKPLP